MKSDLIEKEKMAIERLKAFAPKNGEKYWLAYSGGKDSDAIRILAALADVPHEIHHNLTTVDAPETIQYIKSIPGVQIDKARYADGSPKTMWNLIPKKRIPPTRLARYCCGELKEGGGKGHVVITGVRWEESSNRKENQGVITMIGKPKDTERFLEENNINYRQTKRRGYALNYDNELLNNNNDTLRQCFRTRKTMLNPIVDWTESDVWAFLKHYGCSGNPLYYCGDSRIGCIGCPLAGARQQKKEFARCPKYKALYIKAFQRMIDKRKDDGRFLNEAWKTGEEVFRWWLGEDVNQLTLFAEEELNEVLADMNLL